MLTSSCIQWIIYSTFEQYQPGGHHITKTTQNTHDKRNIGVELVAPTAYSNLEYTDTAIGGVPDLHKIVHIQWNRFK